MHDIVIETNRRVLIIDDNPAIHDDFRKILGEARWPADDDLAKAEHALLGTPIQASARPAFDIDCAFQGEEGLAFVTRAQQMQRPYAVAFVDARMPPGWDGLETIRQIWTRDPDIQIVICTAYSDHSWEQIQNELGLSPRLLILKKPFDPIEVLQLAAALAEKWRLARQTSLHLQHLALSDRMTGLPNRQAFRTVLSAAITRKDRTDELTGLMLLDLDNFKGVNLALGQSAGDFVLEQVAKRLTECLQTSGSVARSGDDEFAVILGSLIDEHAAANAARKLLNALAAPLVVAGQQVSTTACIGVALYPTHACELDVLLQYAELATQFAKRNGRNSVQVYCPELQSHTEQELSRRARIDGRFAQLTDREREVMDLLVSGLTNKAIGQLLGISPRTVEIHRANVMQKMQVGSLPDLVHAAIQVRERRHAM